MEKTPNPEIEALKLNIEVLKTELMNVIYDYEMLVNFVCKNIHDKYLTLIGQSKLELLNLECIAMKRKRKIELIQRCINLDEPIDNEAVENQIQEEMAEWHAKINKYTQDLHRAESSILLLNTSPDDIDLKKLFRKLTMLLHPDINPNLPDKFKPLWSSILNSYINCNIDELKTIEMKIETEKLTDNDILAVNDLVEMKIKLEESLIQYLKKIETIKSSHPYKLIEITENEELLNVEIESINMQQQHYRYLIKNYKLILNSLNTSGKAGFSLN